MTPAAHSKISIRNRHTSPATLSSKTKSPFLTDLLRLTLSAAEGHCIKYCDRVRRMYFFIYQNFLWVTQLFHHCTMFRCSLDPNSCTPEKSHQHLGVHTQAPHRLGYLLKSPSLFWCFPRKTSLAMDHPSLTRVPTGLDVLITAQKLHRAASNFWLH